MTNPRFMFCNDLDSPLLCVIMDTKWFAEWMAGDGPEWLVARGVHGESGLLTMSPEAKMEFILRWGTE